MADGRLGVLVIHMAGHIPFLRMIFAAFRAGQWPVPHCLIVRVYVLVIGADFRAGFQQ